MDLACSWAVREQGDAGFGGRAMAGRLAAACVGD